MFEALANLMGCVSKALSYDKDKVANSLDRLEVSVVPRPEAARCAGEHTLHELSARHASYM